MQSYKLFLAVSLLALTLFWSAVAWAQGPFPQRTSWEDFLRDEEFVALNELHTQRNRFLTQLYRRRVKCFIYGRGRRYLQPLRGCGEYGCDHQ